ncbi:whey acidic protein-like [Onychostoma macrolepis]|uniref:whey acidic protein-like n=1 Tax=Onychostoma macrolepis TaxID=369639 RepID=UPI00272B871E|nr:whey acidic protein-like [Onychostoma macrolepis]
MTAQVYCLLTAVLLCLSGYLSATYVTPSQTDKFCQECSSDGDCPGGDKCCPFDFEPVCILPDSTKPGVCPPKTLLGGSCARSCACLNRKCCRNRCGHCCIAPYTVEPGQYPKPIKIPAC